MEANKLKAVIQNYSYIKYTSMTRQSWTYSGVYSVYCCVLISGSRRRFDSRDELDEAWIYDKSASLDCYNIYIIHFNKSKKRKLKD